MADKFIIESDPIRISTTVRIPKNFEKRIKTYIGIGLFSSVPRFVIEAMRNRLIGLVNNLNKIMPEIEKRYDESDRITAAASTMKQLYIINSRYNEYKFEPSVKQINLNLTASFYYTFIDMMKTYLDMKDLQSMALFCVYYEMASIESYILSGAEIGVGVPGLKKKQNIPSEKDIADIIEKSGLSENNKPRSNPSDDSN